MSKKPDVSRETSEPEGGGKARKTAPVFIYLAVLFAAAFIMLLLAYFVQQRNSENAIDDLRSSMTATREELMEQNRQLQEEKDALQAKLDELEDELRQTALECDEAEDEAEQWKAKAEKGQEYQEQLQLWEAFWKMEECYLRGEYEECAGAFLPRYDVPEEALWRVEEIYDDLVTQGYIEDAG